MENIFIQSGKPEHFEFQLVVHGLSGQDAQVRFVLQSDPFHMMFPCVHANDDTWSLELPSMPWLDPTTYKFILEAIVDGYYFPAHEGTLTVTKSPEIYIKKDDATMKVRSATATTAPAAVADDNYNSIISRLKSDPAATEIVAKAEKKEEKAVKESSVLTEAKTKAQVSGADIIKEHQEEQRRKKKREQKRKLAESESRIVKTKKKETPVGKAPEVSEKYLATKAILEAAKKETSEPKNTIFKKGSTVTK